MGSVVLHTTMRAPIERCFDLTRHIGLHAICYEHARERAVAGVTDGLIGPGESVTFRMYDFGVPHELAVEITAFDRPHHFRDSQTKGIFRRFDHDHRFERRGDATLMTDVFDYELPLGPLGRVLDRLVVHRQVERSMRRRNEVLRAYAESERWRALLEPPQAAPATA